MQLLTLPQRARCCGFTMIEIIITMVILGIVAAIVAVFIAGPIQGYIDSTRRAGLTDVADLALKRMALDIRTAVPNSVRVDGTGKFIEFIPGRAGGRYCTDQDSGCTVLDFSSSNATFDVLSPSLTVLSGDQVILYNTGQSGLNAYESDGSATGNRRALSGAKNDVTTLTLSSTAQTATRLTVSGSAFPFDSPSRRFQLVPSSGPVTFACESVGAAGTLKRYTGYTPAYNITQPTSFSVTGNLLASEVAACSFAYSAVSARNGLLVLNLTITRASESITLHNEIHVDNIP
jgi:MSHA biogenesis protein MshO